MGKNQFSYFFMRGYWDSPQDVMRAISVLNARHYAFIYHDRDIYVEDGETHKKGEHKKPHYHIIVNLPSARSFKAVSRDITTIFPSCGLYCYDLHQPDQALLYLTHETEKAQKEEGKTLYDRNEVYTDNYNYFCSKAVIEEVKKEHMDYILEFLNEVIALRGRVPQALLMQYCQDYGRDFIFNVERVFSVASRFLNKQIEVISNENVGNK